MSDPQQAPLSLSERSVALWTEVTLDYELDGAQLALLEEACRSLDRADEARAIVDEAGATFLDRFDQPKVHPAVGVERDQRGLFARLIRELGLNPLTIDTRPPSIPHRFDD